MLYPDTVRSAGIESIADLRNAGMAIRFPAFLLSLEILVSSATPPYGPQFMRASHLSDRSTVPRTGVSVLGYSCDYFASKIASTSTATPVGREAKPTAERA